MSENKFSPSKSLTSTLRVEELAKRVISELGKKSPAETRDRVIETTVWIANVTTTTGNLRSFGQVSLGTVRIQALLQDLTCVWDNHPDNEQAGGLILIVCQGEDHTLGPLVLADQLRRRGYSINILIGAEEEEIINVSNNSDFDGIMFSCSGIRAFDDLVKLIKNIKEKSENLPPFVLGGKIVDVLEEKIHDMIEVDLITKDLEEALRFLKPKNERAIRNRIERAS
jgi:hypothetical protein